MKLYRVDLTETKTIHMVFRAASKELASWTAQAKVHADPDWFRSPDTQEVEVTTVEELDGLN